MGGRPPSGGGDDAARTIQLRKFAGMNQTDARTAIKDELSGDATEFFWLENAMPIGSGNLRILPHVGSTMAVTAQTTSSIWGFSLNQGGGPLPVLITVNSDGSMTKIDAQTGSQINFASAGTVTTAARMTMWKDSPILIVDPTKGYFFTTGTNIFNISTVTATDVAVFEGRAWLVTGTRSITFTAPNDYTSFSAAAGSGTATVTDSVFAGKIYRLLSALEQLYIVGPGAVETISNVQTASGITTFSITNLVANVGSTHPTSIAAFMRTFVMVNHFGAYAIIGATPQKLSDKMDGFWNLIDFETADDVPAAVTTLYDVFVFTFLVTITDPFTGSRRPVLMCFSQGKWFLGNQGASLRWITGVLSADGDPQLWATDGTKIFQLFADETAPIDYRIMTKLFDFGSGLQQKQWLRVGMEFNSSSAVTATLTAENEKNNAVVSIPLSAANLIIFVGTGPITFVGVAAINFVAAGLQLVRQQLPGGLIGRYLALDLTGTSSPYIMSAIQMQVKPVGKEWN